MKIDISDFFDYLIDTTKNAFAVREGNVLKLNILKDIPDKTDLSSVLRNAMFIIENNTDLWSDLQIEVTIRRSFDDLEVDNDFPSKLSFISCHGTSLQIRRNKGGEESEKKGTYYFFSTSLVSFHIHDSIHAFDSDHLSVMNFKLSNERSAGIFIEEMDFQGTVNELVIHNVLAKKARIDLLNTIGNAETINVNFHYFNPGELYFQARKLVNFSWQGGKSKNTAIILHSDAKLVVIQEIDCENFDLEQKQGKIGELAFRRLSGLKSLTLTGHGFDGGINQIEDLFFHTINFSKDFGGVIEDFAVVGNLKIYNLINQGSLRFTDVDVSSGQLRIGKSRLGNLSFINSKLGKKIFVEASSLEEIRFAGTQVPTEFAEADSNSSSASLTNRIQVVQQIKTVMEKVGDKDLSKYFRQQELRLTYKKISLFKKSECEEKVTLWLNFSNNHGQSWLKPVLLAFFATGPIIFTLFVLSLGYRIDFSGKSFDTFLSLWSHYLDVIIPSYVYPSKNKLAFLEHFLGTTKNELWKLPFGSQLLILLNDVIIMPYLIIQTVTAFRRHVS